MNFDFLKSFFKTNKKANSTPKIEAESNIRTYSKKPSHKASKSVVLTAQQRNIIDNQFVNNISTIIEHVTDSV